MITDEMIDDAIATHNFWKMRLRTMIGAQRVDVPVETIRKDNECRLGKWLYGASLSAADKAAHHYRLVLELHRQFHAAAAQVAQATIDGKIHDARTLMESGGEYSQISKKLESALAEWKRAIA